MCVDRKRDSRRSVPEHVAHHLHGNSCGQHQACNSVATIVQADPWQPARLNPLVEPLSEGVRVVGTSQLVGEKETAIRVCPTRCQFLPRLAGLVRTQDPDKCMTHTLSFQR